MDDQGVIIRFKPILKENDLEKFLEDFPARAMHPNAKDQQLERVYFLQAPIRSCADLIADLSKSYGSIIEYLDIYRRAA